MSFTLRMGHVDFFPAGGEHQPGCTEICGNGNACSDNDLIDLIKGNHITNYNVIAQFNLLVPGGCSHNRSHKYFAESINGLTEFRATKCLSWEKFQAGECDGAETISMGMFVNQRATEGKYYLNVKESSPFAMGK